jgi:tRNA nucleotidyltransferase/poly(A) polymerase
VRDALLDGPAGPQDLDVATQEPPERAARLLEAAGFRVLPTGLAHGTVTALGRHRSYEVTTLRRDVATDGRHAEVAFTDDFVEDAARRDFTINAMSCDAEGRLHDPFGGRADLMAGRIRFVGDPVRRIREDYLRILRWFRFFARFGQEPPDGPALAACAAEATGIDRLSGERLRTELFTLLPLPRAPRAMELMMATGVLGHVVPAPLDPAALPRLRASVGDVDPILALAAMLRPTEPAAAEAVAGRLRLSRAEAIRLLRLAPSPLPDTAASLALHRRGVEAQGRELYLDRLRLAAGEAAADPAAVRPLLDELGAWEPPRFPLDGNDLQAAGVPPGRELGALLAALHAWWRERDFAPDREACLARLRELRRPSCE